MLVVAKKFNATIVNFGNLVSAFALLVLFLVDVVSVVVKLGKFEFDMVMWLNWYRFLDEG